MDYQSLVTLSQTNRENCLAVKYLMRSRIDRILDGFNLDPDKTLQTLKTCDAFISGSAALVALFPGAGPFQPDNIDVFVDAAHLEEMEDFVRQSKYTKSSSLVEFNQPIDPYTEPPFSPRPRGVKEVHRWYHDGLRRRLNLYEVQVHRGKPFEVIVDFHNSLVMNAITHAGVCCAYPELTLNKVGIVKLSAVGHYPDMARIKYAHRGFVFADGWRDQAVRDLVDDDHDCYTYRSCPRLGRWARSDKGFLWLSFELGTDLENVVPDFRWCFFPMEDFLGFYPRAGTLHPCDPYYVAA